VRVVLDTNVVVSGLLWKASPRQVLEAARDKRITLYTTSVLLDELADVLSRPHLVSVIAANHASPPFLMRRYAMLTQLVSPAQTARVVAADRDDDAVIACALAAHADWIVSGDAHLLNLKHYQGMRIIDAAEALRALAQ
jgi:putative PIN family toxin of toxin-antitoxin system